MPQLLPALVQYAVAKIGLSIAVTNFIAGALVFAGKIAAVAAISRALAPKARLGSVRDAAAEVNVRDPAAPRQIIYGLRRVSGVFYPVGTSGTNNEYLHVLLLVAGHEVAELGAVYFGDEEVPLDGSGNATGRYAGHVRIKKHVGTYDQAVDSDLQTDLGSSYWTNNHRLRGIAYLYIRLKLNQELFASGIPEMFCVVKGRKVYDHRDGGHSATDATTWAWSANAALCRADWLRGVPTRNAAGTLVRNYGLGAADDEIDYDSVDVAANVCDEDVGIATSLTRTCDTESGNRHIGCSNTADIVPGLKVSGSGIAAGSLVVAVDDSGTFFTVDRDPTATATGVSLTIGATEKRYLANGVLPSSVRAGDGIETLKTADAGEALYIGGKWVLYSGEYRTPVVTLDDGDLRAPLSGVRLKPSRRELFNAARGLYISPADNWQPADIPRVSNATYRTQDGDEDLWADVELQFTTSASAAQRLNKILIERSRQGIAFVLRCKLSAFEVQAGDVVQYTNARFGWSAKPFEVLSSSLVLESDANGNPYLGVDLSLRETASGVWDWSSGEETTIDVAPNTTLPSPFECAAPTSLAVANSVAQQSDGTAVPRLSVSWTAPADANVTSGGLIRVEYKLAAATDYLPAMITRGDITVALITAVVIGQSYVVRVRAENTLGVASSWVTHTAVTVTGDTTAPAAPSGLTAVAGTGKAISLDWFDNTEADFSEYKVYRNTTNDSSTATQIAEVRASRFVDVEVAFGTTYYYWLKAVDFSENVSAFSTGTSAAAALVPDGSVDTTAPSTPSAPTYVSETTYLSGDGTVFARVTVAAPALPSGARVNQVLYRRSGASAWLIADEVIASGNVSVDDLSPGVAYEFAVRAVSFANVPSAVSSTLSRTSPNKTAGPATPSGGVLSADGVKPKQSASTGVYLFGTRISWAPVSDTDLAYYEVKGTGTDSDGATDYSWTPNDGVNATLKTTSVEGWLYSSGLGPGYVRVRAINRTGVAGSWHRIGNANSAAHIGVGTVAQYDEDDVEMSGVRIGSTSASSVRKVVARYQESAVPTLSGGAPTENFSVSLSNRGFGAKPDVGIVQCSSDANIIAAYDFDHASNSSTNAVIRVATVDGSNIGAGAYRFSIELLEYD